MEDSEKTKKEINKQYNKDPEGWRVYVSKDKDLFTDVLITHHHELWYLKEYSINPYKSIGVSEHLNEGDFEHPYLKDFGLRELKHKDLTQKRENILKILDKKPLSVSQIKSELILEGPVIKTPNLAISKSQKDLDTKLRDELNKMINKKYQHLTYPYL